MVIERLELNMERKMSMKVKAKSSSPKGESSQDRFDHLDRCCRSSNNARTCSRDRNFAIFGDIEQGSPFDLCDVVTSTTHKTLRGPRSGLIFVKKDERGLAEKCDFSVFPMLQGGPHEHQIGALAVQLKEVCSPEWKSYIQKVRRNASTLADSLVERGYTVSSGGTVNHLLLWDLRPTGVTGTQMEKICDAVQITLNKNTVPGDEGGALNPGGVRIGTSAMTTRGLHEADFEKVCDLLDRTVKVAKRIKSETGCEGKKNHHVKAYKKALVTNAEVEALRQEVAAMCSPLFMPGIHDL